MPVKYIPKKEWDEKQKARNEATAELTAEQGKAHEPFPGPPAADQEYIAVDAAEWDKFEDATGKVREEHGKLREAVAARERPPQPAGGPQPPPPAPKPR
jgi:hypothetical protein